MEMSLDMWFIQEKGLKMLVGGKCESYVSLSGKVQ